jgi:hypothetical protein
LTSTLFPNKTHRKYSSLDTSDENSSFNINSTPKLALNGISVHFITTRRYNYYRRLPLWPGPRLGCDDLFFYLSKLSQRVARQRPPPWTFIFTDHSFDNLVAALLHNTRARNLTQ